MQRPTTSRRAVLHALQGAGLVVTGADSGQSLRHAARSGDQEMTRPARGVANCQVEDGLFGVSAFAAVSVQHWIQSAESEEAVHQRCGRVIATSGTAFVASRPCPERKSRFGPTPG